MVSRQEILKDLNSYLSLEEDIIGTLSDFYQALGWRGVIDKKDHEEIEEGLIRLKMDTGRHARLIKEMVAYVKGSDKDEF